MTCSIWASGRSSKIAVAGIFDDDFVRADAIHAVVKSVAVPRGVAFDAQDRGAIGNDAHLPLRARRGVQRLRRRIARRRRRKGLSVCGSRRTEPKAGGIGRAAEKMVHAWVSGSRRISVLSMG